MPARPGSSRTTETNRAANSEWPPRSVKKSASNGIGWGGSTALAAESSSSSVRVRGSSWASAGRAVSGKAFSRLRSTLPEARRGKASMVS